MTTRRELLVSAASGLCLLAVPPAAFAQQKPPKVTRIGYLYGGSSELTRSRFESLRAGLRDLGYIEGKTFVFETRWAEGKYERLPELAAQLVKLKVDVIVAAGTPGIKAAQEATTTIPIVMVATGDPVGLGFIASLPRPGGNITGLSNLNVDLSSKYLELLRAAIPKLSRVAVLVNAGNPTHPHYLPNIEAAARTSGMRVSPVHVSGATQFDAALGTVKQERAGALIVLADAMFSSQAHRIAELAAQQRLPTMFANRDLVEAGGLMSYGQNIAEMYYGAATYVDKILKGAKPGDLPVEQPTKIELVINLKTAKAIGLTIPRDLLFRADKVIE